MIGIKNYSKSLGIFLFAFCFLCQGCFLLERIIDKEGFEERKIFGEAYQNTSKIKELQRYLKYIGYGPGAIDGKIGNNTRRAVKEFQKNCVLKENGCVDKKTWEKLRKVYKDNFLAFKKVNIKKIQTALKNAGFDPGVIDGKKGSKTTKAVKAFQKANSLIQDGKVGPKVWNKLRKYLLIDRNE